MSPRVAILGTGAIGLGAAALLAGRGHAPVLWTRSGTAPPAQEASGALAGRFALAFEPEIGRAVAGADAVMLALPAYGHRAVLDAVLPHLAEGQAVILSGHLSFAGLYLARRLAERRVRLPIIVWGTTVTTGRRLSPESLRIATIRAKVDMATLPAAGGAEGLALCEALFGGRFVPREDLIAIALSNVNPQNHMAIALCNLTRMERGEAWAQNENITDAVGRLIEALDAERLAIAGAFGATVRTVRQHFHLSFHIEEAPLGAMARAMVARGDRTMAPATLETRYVLEDVPFGLVPTARLGRLAGRPAMLHEAGIALLSALYGRDLAAANDLLPALGFDRLAADRLRALSRGEA
jgi:opine dehydrogenase